MGNEISHGHDCVRHGDERFDCSKSAGHSDEQGAFGPGWPAIRRRHVSEWSGAEGRGHEHADGKGVQHSAGGSVRGGDARRAQGQLQRGVHAGSAGSRLRPASGSTARPRGHVEQPLDGDASSGRSPDDDERVNPEERGDRRNGFGGYGYHESDNDAGSARADRSHAAYDAIWQLGRERNDLRRRARTPAAQYQSGDNADRDVGTWSRWQRHEHTRGRQEPSHNGAGAVTAPPTAKAASPTKAAPERSRLNRFSWLAYEQRLRARSDPAIDGRIAPVEDREILQPALVEDGARRLRRAHLPRHAALTERRSARRARLERGAGPAWLQPTTIVGGRLFKFGVQYEF